MLVYKYKTGSSSVGVGDLGAIIPNVGNVAFHTEGADPPRTAFSPDYQFAYIH